MEVVVVLRPSVRRYRGTQGRRRRRVALVVGAILRLLNQGAELASGNADTATALRLVLNCAIPYLVSSILTPSTAERDTRRVNDVESVVTVRA